MSYKVIIIDDEKEISTGFAQFFPWTKLGFTVSGQFSGGVPALEYIKSNPVDIVISDVIMPGMTGIEFAREISLLELEPRPLVILFSAYDEFKYVREAMKYKCTDYIPKTTEYEELIQIFTSLKKQLDERCSASADEDKEDKIITQIKEYVKQNPADANLEEAASRVYMSASYISRYFKQRTDLNFSDYVSSYKMQLASEMLMDLQYKIYEISMFFGYANPVNFTRSFKKHYGISPREFRYEKMGRILPEDEENS
ncbi:response regulator transcription factor [Kineothrix sp. MB12-C1]|uniref:response regulator transcription factor n=1 Tax=Kineothrix sp. MB12-C1 TaxID=3070215 RepID=UPI0027D29851|nr:response regulator [Kineothrix sp. MB12-C1]WMC91080.1 response regulator [Kineothrix sp. MB12-C1]